MIMKIEIDWNFAEKYLLENTSYTNLGGFSPFYNIEFWKTAR